MANGGTGKISKGRNGCVIEINGRLPEVSAWRKQLDANSSLYLPPFFAFNNQFSMIGLLLTEKVSTPGSRPPLSPPRSSPDDPPRRKGERFPGREGALPWMRRDLGEGGKETVRRILICAGSTREGEKQPGRRT